MVDVSDWEESDKLAEVDRGCGDAIEKTISRFLPREGVRDARKEAVRRIRDVIWSASTPDEGPHETPINSYDGEAQKVNMAGIHVIAVLDSRFAEAVERILRMSWDRQDQSHCRG